MNTLQKGNAEAFVIIAIVVIAGFFLTGGLFQYKYTNQISPGAYIPLSPSPDSSQKTMQFHAFRFLYLTPTPTPDNSINSNPGIGPNTSTCGGKYVLYNTLHLNFGDPACDFSKNGLMSLLQKIDPGNAYFWFLVVIPCESGYNPNAEQMYDPYDPAHAWGLFQMGRGKNGPLDHGDVVWQKQASNAVSYNNNLIKYGVQWHYWACARSRW